MINEEARGSGMLSRRGFIAGAGAAGAAALLSGCTAGAGEGGSTPSGSGSEGASSQVIVAMNAGSEPAAGFDPLVAWGCGEHVHEPLIQSTLITTDENLEFINDLATSYSCSDDGLTWTFELRDDVAFTDGEPLTASDVAFTVNSAIQSDTFEGDLSMVDEAVAANDTVVELHLNKPYNALLYTLAVLGIVPEHAYGDGYGSAPIGSGRYMLERWDRSQQAIFSANPDYYGEPPLMERVVVVFMEEDAALAAVQAGEVDIAYTYATHAQQSFDGYELVSYATVDSRGISLPTEPAGGTKSEGGTSYAMGNDVTSDLSVRRALTYAIDRDAVIGNVLSGYGKPAYSVSDDMPWSSDDMKVELDRDLAARLLDDAGWAIASDGVRAKDGMRAAFDIWYSSDDSARAIANKLSTVCTDWHRADPARRWLGRDLQPPVKRRSSGGGVPTRPSRYMRSTTLRAGATTRATRTRRSTPISTRRWRSRTSRIPTRTGSSRHGTARSASRPRALQRGRGLPASTISTSSARLVVADKAASPMGMDGRS